MPEKTLENLVKSGTENHKKMMAYLKEKVLVNGDLNF